MGDKVRPRSHGSRPTDDALLDAARAVFAERGFDRATMGLIAEEADTTKPTLYAHFGDKEALYRALIAREAEALGAWVTRAYDSAASLPVEERVEVYVMALFTFASENMDGFRLLFDTRSAGDPSRLQLVELITSRVAEQVGRYLTSRGHTPGPNAGILAAMLVGVVGKAAETALRQEQDPLQAGRVATAFIMNGLAHLPPEVLTG